MGRPRKIKEKEVLATEEKPVKPEKVLPPLCKVLDSTKLGPVIQETWGSFIPMDEGTGWKYRKVQLSQERVYLGNLGKAEEELLTYLEGNATITIEGMSIKDRKVTKGDASFIPRGGAFTIKNVGSTPFIFLEMKFSE